MPTAMILIAGARVLTPTARVSVSANNAVGFRSNTAGFFLMEDQVKAPIRKKKEVTISKKK